MTAGPRPVALWGTTGTVVSAAVCRGRCHWYTVASIWRFTPFGGGGGGACHRGVLFSSAVGGAYWPIAIHCPSLGPFSSIGGGAPRPLTTLCPPSPSLAYLSLSLHFPFLGGRGTLHQLVGIRLLSRSVNPTFPNS